MKKYFVPPKQAVIHFDGKLLKDLSGAFGDRLAVVLSGNTDQCRQGKLLSARMIQGGTGKLQAEEVMRSIVEWKVQPCVKALCFDTTSSNTGWLSGRQFK